MKIIRVLLAIFAAFTLLSANAAATPALYFQLFVHNEDTPNFSNSSTLYITWRQGLLAFAQMCDERGLKWDLQSDWSWLEGVRKWEINPATAIPGITDTTGGLNVMQYLHQHYGVELDPHSHEAQGYSYADVAWLHTQCNVTPSPMVGGHLFDPVTNTALNFDRLSDPAGVVATKYGGAPNFAPNWFPTLFTAGGSAGHTNDPHAAGIWRPASATNYHTHSDTGRVAAIGGWQRDLYAIDQLIRGLESGELPNGRMWTAGYIINHGNIINASDRNTTARMELDTIKRWQDAGRIQVTTYEEAVSIWQTTFVGAGNVHERPHDNVSFSLHWQDFYYTALSATYLHSLLTLHETYGVPLDVFLPTWQTDIIQQQYPELLGRLQSSALVAQSYLVRPPKPYASNFAWGTITTPGSNKPAIITNYETHGLDLASGQATTAAGSFDKLKTLQGYAPLCVLALPPTSLATYVNGVFRDLGALMLVRQAASTNLSTRDMSSQLYYRPEHRDWKLSGVWTPVSGDPQPATLTDALTEAHLTASSGGIAPWFVGVKLNDDDLFATQSQWSLIYPATAPRPWNTNQHSAEIADTDKTARYAFYQTLVQEAAGRTAELNLTNSFDTMSLMEDAPVRPIGLSRTSINEDQPINTTLARLSGGGGVSGHAVSYELVSGAGADNNADFTISGDELRAANRLDYETNSVRHLRVRWSWIDTLDNTTVLGSGERALTLVLNNVTTDDDDGDGMTEAQEIIAGTDPANLASVFRILSMIPTPGTSIVDVTVSSVPGRHYTLRSSTDLISWSDEDDPNVINVIATGNTLTLRDLNAPGPRKYYRVHVNQ